MSQLSDIEKEVRKLRKKLRQIENLERLEFEGQELNEEEENKVSKKNDYRDTLKVYLSRYEEELQNKSVSTEAEVVTSSDLSLNISNASSQGASFDEDKYVAETLTDLSLDEGKLDKNTSKKKDNIPKTKPMDSNSDIFKDVEEDETDTLAHTPIPKSPKKREVGRTKESAPKKQKKETVVASVKPKELTPSERLKQDWLQSHMTVFLLEGHNDLVTAVHLDREWLVTGSRDTMVKVWDTSNGLEEKSFGGHTDSITAVLVLSTRASFKLNEHFELSTSDRLLVSASHDCSIKLWSLESGKPCLSMYTYNPVTSMAFLDAPAYIVSGSGGGKVELWDPVSASCVQTQIAHIGAVTSIETDASMVYTAGSDGLVKVFQLRATELHLLHSSEDVTCGPGSLLHLRPVRSLSIQGEKIYYGDDGTNVKCLDWKRGLVHKLKHHTGEFGSTDAMCCMDNAIIASGYDLDDGIGYLNVWGLPWEKYLCTLKDESFTRFMSLSAAKDNNGRIMFATGGVELRLWIPTANKSSDDFIIHGVHVDEYGRRPVDSDPESDEENTESETEASAYFWSRKQTPTDTNSKDEETQGWTSWCSLL